MYKEGKVYVPKDNKLRAEIIRLHHNMCYGSPEQEKVSRAFKHLVQNLKAYNGVEI